MAILEAKHLAKSYKKRQVVIDVSIAVESGQAVGLLGPNGAGKTTCFYMIVGMVPNDEGGIFIDGESVTDLAMHARAQKGIGYLPQEASIFRKMSVENNISAILETRKSLSKQERKEKLDEQLPSFIRVKDRGFNNKFGWLIQGYIEDYNGELRPQSYEETSFCMGCHSAIGTTIDQTFAFPRKVTGKAGWGYINLKGMKDSPSKGQQEGEILQYLQVNGGGNEFRENTEMFKKWYKSDGTVNKEKVKNADVFQLITPSKQRAYDLNKAYTQIVRTQSYIHGRDANISPAINVHKTIDESVAPLKAEYRLDGWDIRLDWSNSQ